MTTIELEAELVEAHRLADAAPGFVHVGLRQQQRDALAADRPLGDQPLEARAERADAMLFGDALDRHEADVVAIAGVFGAGIAEPCDEQHVPSRFEKGPPAGMGGRA